MRERVGFDDEEVEVTGTVDNEEVVDDEMRGVAETAGTYAAFERVEARRGEEDLD